MSQTQPNEGDSLIEPNNKAPQPQVKKIDDNINLNPAKPVQNISHELTNSNIKNDNKDDLKNNDNDDEDELVYPENYKNTKTKGDVVCYFIFAIIFAIINHIIKPLCVILELIYVTYIADYSPSPSDPYEIEPLDNTYITLSYLVIFLLPIINIWTIIQMISIQSGWEYYLYSGILSLAELIFQMPLTFLYPNNLFSIYLFDQRGFEQVLSPWLIFFPSDFLLSIQEIIRQYIESIYFFIFFYMLSKELKKNIYHILYYPFSIIAMIFLAIKFITNVVMMFIRIVNGNSINRGRRKILKKNIKNKEKEK